MSERREKTSKQVQVVDDAKTKTKGLKQLIHNGVLVPDPYTPQGFTLTFRGTPLKLSPLQEEMAVRFAQKFGTPYRGGSKVSIKLHGRLRESPGR